MLDMTGQTESITQDAVKLISVGKQYPVKAGPRGACGRQNVNALNGISLSIAKGEFVGIIGRNGAGKTTLLNIIAGVTTPSEGSCTVSGRVVGLFNLGAGFQDELSGRENIFLNGAILKATRREMEEKLPDIIEFSELGDFIDMPLGSYSQGMRLRLGFGIIANLDFDILVLDEVLAVGDVLFQDKCMKRIMSFKHRGKTLVLSTQDLAMVERLCSGAVLLDHGYMIFRGSAGETAAKYRELLSTERFYVGFAKRPRTLIDSTIKWTADISSWGTKRGTKEVSILDVKFLNRWGVPQVSFSPGDPVTVKTHVEVRERVSDPHLGVAFFREDGVYCYGPNTEFDGHRISQMAPGKGFFAIKIPRLFLAPGAYRVSIAVWDRDERLAYDLHEACYSFRVLGTADPDRPLSALPVRVRRLRHAEKTGKRLWMEDGSGTVSERFLTGSCVRIFVDGDGKTAGNRTAGIFRDDGICCQKITLPFAYGTRIEFPRCGLLPGTYEVRLDGMRYVFKMLFDRFDHGTIFLDHAWEWRIGKERVL